jgi:hypothetical protein
VRATERKQADLAQEIADTTLAKYDAMCGSLEGADLRETDAMNL